MKETLELGLERGRERVLGRGNRIRAQILVPPLPGHLPADRVPLTGLQGGLSEAIGSNSIGLDAQGELRTGGC